MANFGDQKSEYEVQKKGFSPNSYSNWSKFGKSYCNFLGMEVTDDGGDVFYKPPGAKKRQAKNEHNLMDAVTNVRGAEKKQ